nr:hypothetical protein [Microbulbifer harenosus]
MHCDIAHPLGTQRFNGSPWPEMGATGAKIGYIGDPFATVATQVAIM